MAIAAAAPNDSIYVLPGLYTEAEGLVIDKPLTVLGSGSLVTRVDIPTSTFASGCKPLEIRDSLATEVVQVGGFELSATELFGLGCPVRILDCSGPALLHDVANYQLDHNPPFTSRRLHLEVERSLNVTIERCAFEGIHNAGNCGDPPAGGRPAVLATDSFLTVNSSTFWGGDPIESCFNVDGAAGLSLVRSIARVAASTLEGSESQNTLSGGFLGWRGLELVESSAELFAGTEVLGGAHGPFVRATAVILEPGSEVLATDDVTFVSFPFDEPIVDLGGTLTTSAERWIAGLFTPGIAPMGSNVSLELVGEPASLALTYIGSLQPVLSIPGVIGALHILPTPLSPFSMATLDAAGVSSTSLFVPTDVQLQGASLSFQTLGVSPSLALSLSPPFSFGVQL